MPANYVDRVDTVLPVGLETNLTAAVPSGTVQMLNQIILTNPAGGRAGIVNGLSGICGATDGRVFVLAGNGSGGYVVEIAATPDASGNNARVVAGLPGFSGTTNATGTLARFGTNCLGMVWVNGSLYICDQSNNQIRAVNTTTYAVTLFAGSAAGTAGQADGTGSGATFTGPRCIATDGTNLYVGQSAASPAPSIRQIVISSGAVTTRTGTAHQNTTARVDSIAVSSDGLRLFYAESAATSGTSWLFSYLLSSSTRTTITGSTLNAGTGVVANGIYALNTTNPGGGCVSFFQNVTAYPSICADPNDASAFLVYLNANTASSGSTNKIHRVKLLPDAATATHFEVSPFAFSGGNTPGVVEGIGQTAGPLVGSNFTGMGPSAHGGALLVYDGVSASNAGRVWAVDVQDGLAALVTVGEAVGVWSNWQTAANRTAYASISAKRAGDAGNRAWRRLVTRLAVAPGETVTVDLTSVLEAGDVLTGLALNAPVHVVVPMLEET